MYIVQTFPDPPPIKSLDNKFAWFSKIAQTKFRFGVRPPPPLEKVCTYFRFLEDPYGGRALVVIFVKLQPMQFLKFSNPPKKIITYLHTHPPPPFQLKSTVIFWQTPPPPLSDIEIFAWSLKERVKKSQNFKLWVNRGGGVQVILPGSESNFLLLKNYCQAKFYITMVKF